MREICFHTAGGLLKICPHICPALTSTSHLVSFQHMLRMRLAYPYTNPLTEDIAEPLFGAAAYVQYTHVVRTRPLTQVIRRGHIWGYIWLAYALHLPYVVGCLRRAPIATAACWPVPRFSMCSAYAPSNSWAGALPSLGLEIGSLSVSECATHMFFRCLPWW